MSSARRIYLNACDRLFLGQHQLQVRAASNGNIAFMVLELDGDVACETMREALARAMAAHPVTMAGLRVSQPFGKPFWKIPPSPAHAAEEAAAKAHVYEDLRNEPHWEARLAALCQERCVPPWDLRTGPQVRLDHYALPAERTRLCIHWPHPLMDAEGAQWFLGKMGERPEPRDSQYDGSGPGAEASTGRRSCLLPDDQSPRILAGRSLRDRWRLFRRGMASQRVADGLTIRPLVSKSPRGRSEQRVLHKHWNAGQVSRMQDSAKQAVPSGPAPYARFLAASVMRALHRLHEDHGAATDAYMITLPMRLGVSQPAANLMEKRPVPGNFLVTPVICCTPRQVADRRVLDQAVFDQVQDYLRQELDLAQWTLMGAASLIHAWFYPLIFKLSMGVNVLSSGFSYYGVIEQPGRSIAGATITNCWGGGPLPMPPGWNPVFSKFGDGLNLSLTYAWPAISDELASRYVELIALEAFGSDGG